MEIGSDNEIEESIGDCPDITQILAQFFIEPKKQRNITEVLCEIKRQLELHNQLMSKMLESKKS